MVVMFSIPGEPRGKGRPRFGRTKSGAPVTFTDAKTASYENLVALAAREAMCGMAPIEGPLNVALRIRLVPPKSLAKPLRALALAGRHPVMGRFDLDNLVKAVTDGMNAIAYADDRQIIRLTAEKVGSDTAGVDVIITPYHREAI